MVEAEVTGRKGGREVEAFVGGQVSLILLMEEEDQRVMDRWLEGGVAMVAGAG